MEANYLTILWWFLPYIDVNQPQVHMCPPSWSPLPPPSPLYPSGLSQSTGFECPASCIELARVIYFTYGNIHISMLFSQIVPLLPSPTYSKCLFFTSVEKTQSNSDTGVCPWVSVFSIVKCCLSASSPQIFSMHFPGDRYFNLQNRAHGMWFTKTKINEKRGEGGDERESSGLIITLTLCTCVKYVTKPCTLQIWAYLSYEAMTVA